MGAAPATAGATNRGSRRARERLDRRRRRLRLLRVELGESRRVLDRGEPLAAVARPAGRGRSRGRGERERAGLRFRRLRRRPAAAPDGLRSRAGTLAPRSPSFRTLARRRRRLSRTASSTWWAASTPAAGSPASHWHSTSEPDAGRECLGRHRANILPQPRRAVGSTRSAAGRRATTPTSPCSRSTDREPEAGLAFRPCRSLAAAPAPPSSRAGSSPSEARSRRARSRSVFAYTPAARRWQRLADLPTPRHGLGVIAHRDRVYAVAGGPQPGLTTSGAVESLRVP